MEFVKDGKDMLTDLTSLTFKIEMCCEPVSDFGRIGFGRLRALNKPAPIAFTLPLPGPYSLSTVVGEFQKMHDPTPTPTTCRGSLHV